MTPGWKWFGLMAAIAGVAVLILTGVAIGDWGLGFLLGLLACAATLGFKGLILALSEIRRNIRRR